MEIENHNLDEWLSVLKPYQQKIMHSLIDKYGEEDAIKRWIKSKGPLNTATFGGVPTNDDKKNYYQCIKQEINYFICGNPKYSKERDNILKGANVISISIASKISQIIAQAVGMSIAVVLPAILLLFHSISKISINAYCSMIEKN
jgi:hypothetical protein